MNSFQKIATILPILAAIIISTFFSESIEKVNGISTTFVDQMRTISFFALSITLMIYSGWIRKAEQ